MIGVLTHHWAINSKVDEARKLLDGNGLAQSKTHGFVSRHTLHALDNHTQITSLVLWDSTEVYEAWRASPERATAMAGAEDMWAKSPQSQRFKVVGTPTT